MNTQACEVRKIANNAFVYYVYTPLEYILPRL
jgi:hypothetical protein